MASSSKNVNSARSRILLAKPGMDGHNRGIRVISRALMNHGHEIIYLGIRRSTHEIAAAAIQEDADIVGISMLSGAHLELTAEVRRELDRLGGIDIPLICGGIIPAEDWNELRRAGADAIFGPGTSIKEITSRIDLLLVEGRSPT